MAVDFWNDMSLLVGGFELAGHAKDFKLSGECGALDTTALSNTDGYVSLIAGTKTVNIDFSVMADFADDGLDETIYGLLGTAGTPKSVVLGSADGSFAYTMRGIVLGYTPVEGNPGDLAMGRIAGRNSSGPLVRGQLLHPGGTARTSSSTGTGRQLGALLSTQSLYAALHVLSVSGTDTPTLTVKVQSDDNADFTSATDRITFTGATATGAQWSSVAGAVTDDYWRISYTISGTDPSFLFAVVAGIAAT